MRTIVTIVGARPQFVKASAVSAVFGREDSLREVLVHTGQHYDPMLSDVFFEELGIPRPAHHLEVGSGPHGAQTAAMLQKIEQVILLERPDVVLVYGDTNSTLAGALAAAKLHVPVAHVEAGLRSFNRRMPEEINRVLTDHASTFLFCPTLGAVAQLAREGIVEGVHHVGDVMYDVALRAANRTDSVPRGRSELGERAFVLATIHRAETTDDPACLQSAFDGLALVAARLPVVVPIHPRTRQAMASAGIVAASGVRIVDPVGFLEMTWLERHAALVVTDSGGVQKEAYFHRTPCVTLRTETEWVETVAAGWNRLADPKSPSAIAAAADAMLDGSRDRREIMDYGTGAAAEAVVAELRRHLG